MPPEMATLSPLYIKLSLFLGSCSISSSIASSWISESFELLNLFWVYCCSFKNASCFCYCYYINGEGVPSLDISDLLLFSRLIFCISFDYWSSLEFSSEICLDCSLSCLIIWAKMHWFGSGYELRPICCWIYCLSFGLIWSLWFLLEIPISGR